MTKISQKKATIWRSEFGDQTTLFHAVKLTSDTPTLNFYSTWSTSVHTAQSLSDKIERPAAEFFSAIWHILPSNFKERHYHRTIISGVCTKFEENITAVIRVHQICFRLYIFLHFETHAAQSHVVSNIKTRFRTFVPPT